MLSSLKNYLLKLNIFEPSTNSTEQENVQERHWNIVATRLYFLVLLLILLVVAVISWLSTEVVVIIIHHPTGKEFGYLPSDAQCPCSHGSVSYEDFTSLKPTFHQVCFSDFVSDRWIEAIFSGSNSTYFYANDFRTFGAGQFQALASFCRLSMANIQNSISTFKLTTLISLNVLSEMALRQQTKAAIEQFISMARRQFTAQLNLTLQMTVANSLISGLQTNHQLFYSVDNSQLLSIGLVDRSITKDDNTRCSCLLDPYCATQAVFDPSFAAWGPDSHSEPSSLPGISSGCLPVSSMLSSTLECFYNQTCVDFVLSFFPTSARFSAMEPSQHSIYSLTSTVQSMVDQLMIENWTIDISYEKYYAQCAPASCKYSRVARHGIRFALIQVISLLATLSSVIGIIIPKLIRCVRSRLNPIPQPSPSIKVVDRLQLMNTAIMKLMFEFNIFNNKRISNRPIKSQIYGTRIYIVLLTASLMILYIYTWLVQSIHRRTVLNPSESQYLQLEQAYPASLSCPCTSINMSYSTFITSEPDYHQVCSSALVTHQWLEYLDALHIGSGYIYDYRINAAVQFKTLAFLCEYARQTVNDALDTFLRTELVASQVIPPKLFESQIYSQIQEWDSTTINQFVRSIEMMRDTTHSNQLLNRLNIYLFPENHPARVVIHPRDYAYCLCVFERTCRANMGIYHYDLFDRNVTLIHAVPNFFVGCYLVDALFMSTLECFYDESCLIELDQYLNVPMRQLTSFPVLDATLNPPDERIEMIVNRLLLNSWTSTVNFSSYYKTCAPSTCTFEYKSRNGLFFVITTIIGVFGGLSLAYKLVIFIGLQLIEKLTNGISFAALIQLRRRLFSYNNDEEKVYRLHILLVIITLVSIYSTITFTPKQMTVETVKPSLRDYQQLIQDYRGSVQCSCSQISIKYRSFLEMAARFHPVCSDGFISRYWFFLLSNGPLIYALSSRAFVYSGGAQVQGIVYFCTLSQQIVTDSFRRLLSGDFINAQLLPPDLFYQRMRRLLDDFHMTMPKSTINTLSLIRQITAANMIMNTLSDNWIFTEDNVFHGWMARTKPVVYQGCTCGLSSQCSATVSGVRYGCYVIEALMQSTFETLYTSQHVGLNISFPALDRTLNPTRFGINATVESIVNELMVEEFSSNLSYANYFAQCEPSLCISSYTEKSNLFEGMTMLISLYGGLVIICRVIAIMITKLLRRPQLRVFPIIQ